MFVKVSLKSFEILTRMSEQLPKVVNVFPKQGCHWQDVRLRALLLHA